MTVQAQFLTHETAPLQEILVLEWMNECGSRSVMSDCNPMDYMVRWILQARILEWVACSLLQGIFPIQGWNLGLPHCRQILNQLSHRGSPLSCRLEPNSTLGSMFHPHPSNLVLILFHQHNVINVINDCDTLWDCQDHTALWCCRKQHSPKAKL